MGAHFRILWSPIVLNPSLSLPVSLRFSFDTRPHPFFSLVLAAAAATAAVHLSPSASGGLESSNEVPGSLSHPRFLFVVIRERVGSNSRIKINQLGSSLGKPDVNQMSWARMYSEGKFGRGPRELTGETEIRKGEGMELGQLFQSAQYLRETTAQIQQFDLEILGQAFQLRDTAPIDLPSSEKGIPTISGKSIGDSKDKERKHRKHKDKDREKDKEHKKHKHRHKDRTKDKEKKKDKSGRHDSGGDHSKKHHEKKRKHDGNEDSVDNHKHKKSKHKSLKIEEVGVRRISFLAPEFFEFASIHLFTLHGSTLI
ncbi:hypothetical protein OPV22_025119 [Ensete ventricosum]|uniref:Uncharacterized protein n=1 Tax=Ensete ventricosum TaxID=4639 RepID=A0AAV8P754_ENSVE|nr:hypothetical protein OPV22_025119 [Ensete ventricosum]